MPRISKNDVNQALSKAGKNIEDAAGKDQVASRKDVKNKLATLSGTEKALTDQFYKFIDHRDAKLGARVTQKDVEKALAYAKDHLIDKYDVNGNGLSKTEIARMSKLGQLAVEFARELKSGGKINQTGGTTTGGGDVAAALRSAGKDTWYMSESDYPIGVVSLPSPSGTLTSASAQAALGDTAAGFFSKAHNDTEKASDFAYQVSSAADTKAFLDQLCVSPDPTDDYQNKNAAGFTRIRDVLNQNVTDLRLVKIGTRDSSGQLAKDSGLYLYALVGKGSDGKLDGVTFGSVET